MMACSKFCVSQQHSKKVFYTFLILLFLLNVGYAQRKVKPYRCGYAPKDFTDLKTNFDNMTSQFGCKPGEKIASVGASNGAVEAQISVFIDSLDWTIQDIDTACLNRTEFKKVLDYHERLKGQPLKASFELVLGEQCKTNLQSDYYDRILLCNVYHELSNPKCLVADIHTALKASGRLVVMELMATKIGQKKRDCGHRMLWEPDFVNDLNSLGFHLEEKLTNKSVFTFFVFSKS